MHLKESNLKTCFFRDLSNNAITSLGEEKFKNTPLLEDLLLQYNHISHIPASAFVGLKKLQIL